MASSLPLKTNEEDPENEDTISLYQPKDKDDVAEQPYKIIFHLTRADLESLNRATEPPQMNKTLEAEMLGEIQNLKFTTTKKVFYHNLFLNVFCCFGWCGYYLLEKTDLDKLTRQLKKGEDAKINALDTLCELAKSTTNSLLMVNNPELLKGLIDLFQNADDVYYKERVMQCIYLLAAHFETYQSQFIPLKLFSTPNLMNVIFREIRSGKTDYLRGTAISIVWCIADAQPLKVDLFNYPKLIDTCVDLFKNGENDHIKECGCTIIQDLTLAVENREGFLKRKDIIDLLLWGQSHAVRESQQVKCTMALVNIAGSDESKKHWYDSELGHVLKIVEVLKSSIRMIKSKHPESTAYLETLWPLSHALMSLRYLLILEKHREILESKTPLLALLQQALGKAIESKDPLSAELTLSCLIQFCFDEKPLSSFKKNRKLQNLAASVPSQWGRARRAVDGFVFKVQHEGDKSFMSFRDSVDKGRPRKGSFLGNEKKHQTETNGKLAEKSETVMISYNWGVQHVARKVDEYLTLQGFKVWRDEHELHGNIFDGMANAVESSGSFIAIITKAYQESPTCKIELTHAFNMNKRIIPLLAQPGYNFKVDGWLGVMLGANLYYDLTDPNPNRVNFELTSMVQKELRRKDKQSLVGAPQQHMGTVVDDQTQRFSDSGQTTAQIPQKNATSPSLRVAVPNSEEEIRQRRPDLAEYLIREGIVDSHSLQNLRGRSAERLKPFLNLPNAKVALDLEEAIESLFGN